MNKVPVLDKGYVALFSNSISNETFNTFRVWFSDKSDEKLLRTPTVHLMIKCPIFVRLIFAEHNLSTLVQNIKTVDAYIPKVNEIHAGDLKTSEEIQQNIEQTIEALLINPQSYQQDTCNTFISQVVSPISIYNTVLVSGNLWQWIQFLKQKNLPSPIEAYRKVIEDVITAEWYWVLDYIKEQ